MDLLNSQPRSMDEAILRLQTAGYQKHGMYNPHIGRVFWRKGASCVTIMHDDDAFKIVKVDDGVIPTIIPIKAENNGDWPAGSEQDIADIGEAIQESNETGDWDWTH